VDENRNLFTQGEMTVIVPGPTENLETFPLGGRFRPYFLHVSGKVTKSKALFQISSF
jgi:hypothetical protein